MLLIYEYDQSGLFVVVSAVTTSGVERAVSTGHHRRSPSAALEHEQHAENLKLDSSVDLTHNGEYYSYSSIDLTHNGEYYSYSFKRCLFNCIDWM